jgi:hypothetical protein
MRKESKMRKRYLDDEDDYEFDNDIDDEDDMFEDDEDGDDDFDEEAAKELEYSNTRQDEEGTQFDPEIDHG